MTGPFVAVLAAMVAACSLLLALVRRHVPAEGLLPWLRESYRSVRAEHGEQAQAPLSSAVDEGSTAHVADLLEMGEDGPAYHRPPDLLERFGRRRSSR
ncbi:hypothetical protein [Ruania albidiflava]|uniref:hypothetical protein n=1 Tax=Ruania albidiflava TaxID=366586 RepID=UPI0003B654EF|nr:hypothetical protein [Ruania albidiflava]